MIVHWNHSWDTYDLSSGRENHLGCLIQYIGNAEGEGLPLAYLACDLPKAPSCFTGLFFNKRSQIPSSAEVFWTEEVEKGICKSGVPREDLHGISTKSLDRVEGLDGKKLTFKSGPKIQQVGGTAGLTSIIIALGLGRGAWCVPVFVQTSSSSAMIDFQAFLKCSSPSGEKKNSMSPIAITL